MSTTHAGENYILTTRDTKKMNSIPYAAASLSPRTLVLSQDTLLCLADEFSPHTALHFSVLLMTESSRNVSLSPP